eukprot:SAG31_NODE_44_length_31168_cov_16.507290_11_plen_864_part_00
MFLENTVSSDAELPAWWAHNRWVCMLLNLTLFVPGIICFGYLSWCHLFSKSRAAMNSSVPLTHETSGDDQTVSAPPRHKVKLTRVAGYAWSVVVHLVLQTLPYVIYKQWYTEDKTQANIAITIAGVFTGLTIAYGIREVKSHLQNYFQPRIQKHIIRILVRTLFPYVLTAAQNQSYIADAISSVQIMPIVYAIDCMVSLTWLQYDAYVHLIREQYEAYTVWSFQALMMEFLINVAKDRYKKGLLNTDKATGELGQHLGGDNPLMDVRGIGSFLSDGHRNIQKTEELKPEDLLVMLLEQDGHEPIHMFPVNKLLKPWRKGSHFLSKCRAGVLQYVAYSSSMSLINLVLQLTDNFHEGEISLHSGYVWVVAVRTISQSWALYCLVLFYHVTADLLAPIRPFPKFVAIKLIVFATFWQSVVIAVLIEIKPEILVSAWRFKYGTCVPPENTGPPSNFQRNLTCTLAISQGSEPWTNGWCGYDDSFSAGWNSSEQRCVDNKWRWRHVTIPEKVCMDGRSSSDCICDEQICFADATAATYRGDVSTGLQDLLVCIEMFIASLAHAWCFTYKAHRDETGRHRKTTTKKALVEMANWSDVGENGLLGMKQMLHDSRRVAQSMKRGFLDPEELEYYWPHAKLLNTALLLQLREKIDGEVAAREYKIMLRAVPILSTLSDAMIDEIAHGAQLCTFEDGEIIVHEGATDSDLYVLVSGTAVVTKLATGGMSQILHEFLAGDHFGEQALLHGKSRSATISTSSAGTKCLKISKHVYSHVLSDHAARAQVIASQQGGEFSDRLEDVTTHRVDDDARVGLGVATVLERVAHVDPLNVWARVTHADPLSSLNIRRRGDKGNMEDDVVAAIWDDIDEEQ